MNQPTRRDVLRTVPAAALLGASKGFAVTSHTQRVFIASNTPEGIRAFDWNPATGDLSYAGVAATVDNVDWICLSPDRKTIFAAAEVDSFKGKPTGEVASLGLNSGKLTQISAENSASKGTCQCAIDHTGQTLLAADYGGGSAASFKVTNGALSSAVWSQHYTQHGPNPKRQESAHAHFASYSPDNQYAFINDLGGDCIHIYRLHPATAELTPHGEWHSEPGFGPRTLHFHPNGVNAYCMNEMASTVSVLRWNKAEGKFTTISQFPLHPDPAKAPNTGCDTVITRDGRFVYFANRGDDFLLSCKCDPQSGALTAIGKTPSGGTTPRNFTLDPTERWMLVANQNSSQLSVFVRDPRTGALADHGRNYDCRTPMCILFV
jgi:6-phosphogluconolactonase